MFGHTIVKGKWLTEIWKSLFLTAMFITFLNTAVAASPWRFLATGIEYLDLEESYLTPWSHVHVFRISLESRKLILAVARDLAVKYASVNEYAHYSKAFITINGGFFDQNFQPLGLRISNGKQESPLKSISWWGIFYIKNQKPRIATVRRFVQDSQIDFAVQSGPRLLIKGQIPPLKPGRAERSALGITRDGKVIILVTDHAALSTTELAQLMKAAPLDCINALNLDGGSSSQLYAKINSFRLNVHGLSNVSDAILVK